MVFQRALLRELTVAFSTVFASLFAIVVTILVVNNLVRYLGDAASGVITSEAVAALLGFSLVGYLPVILSLTLFIAVLLTLTRSYRDSEMVVWFSAGLSLAGWVRPVMMFALPVVGAIALLSFVLTPWSIQQSAEYRRQLDSRDEVAAVSPGVFRESKRAERVYFVEGLAPGEKAVKNVFMQSVQNGKLGVMVSQSGYQETAPNHDKFMVLVDGRRYEGEAGSAEFSILEFQRYAVRVETYEATVGETSPKQLTTGQLLRERTPANLGEFLWRLGLPVSALVLALMAIPLSFVNPRAGRSLNLIFALLLYMTYSNLVSIAQAWVAQEKLNFAVGMWVVHVVMAGLLLALFYRRLTLFSIFSFLRLRRQA